MASIKQQIYNYLINLTCNGKLKPSDIMPAESVLCAMFKTSRSTVRLAYQQLVHEGYVERKPGLGTFIIDKKKSTALHIGVIISGEYALDSSFDPIAGSLKNDIFNGILTRAHETNTMVSLIPVTSDWQPEKKFDGYAAIFIENNILKLLEKHKVIYSLCPIGNSPPGHIGAAIDFNQDFKECLNYLLARGYQKIGLVDLEKKNYRATETYRKVMLEASIEFSDSIVEYYDNNPMSGRDAFVRLISKNQDIDAVFFRTDVAAIESIEYCAKVGIKVPDDISIISYDNIPQSEFTSPPLTTYDPARKEIGYLAMRQIENAIKGITQANETVYISGKIVERESI